MEDPRSFPHNEGGFEMTIGSRKSVSGTRGTAAVGQLGLEDAPANDQETIYASGTSSTAGAVANFLNSIVGAGIVGLPFALAQVRVRVCLLLGVWK